MADSGSSTMKTAMFVLAWFTFNISMSNVTKWLFLYGELCTGEQCIKYDFPLTMTSFAIAVGRVLSGWYLSLFLPDLPHVSFSQQLREIAPLGACFALSVGMGNLSLKYIYPSFNQMIGAASPLITVIMALIAGERYNSWTWASMPIICGGIAACAVGEMNFHLLGALSCVGAAILRGVKSIIQARLLGGRNSRRLDSVELLYYMSPYAAATLYVCALLMEGVEPVLALCWKPMWSSTSGVGYVVCLVMLSALNAWFLSVTNLLVTYHTNAVTLQVLGNVKTCLSIMISVAVFKNELLPMQCLGVLSCLFGVWLYGRYGRAIKSDEKKKG